MNILIAILFILLPAPIIWLNNRVKIVEKIGKEHISETGQKLKELLGHTPIQVFAGAILGIVIAVLRHM